MSKLIDYAGLTEFYNKFKEEITAPEIVYLKYTEDGGRIDESARSFNETALTNFKTKWITLHGNNRSGGYFLGVFRGLSITSMFFVKSHGSFLAYSDVNLLIDNEFYPDHQKLYKYILNVDGTILKTIVTDPLKQDTLISGTNIKTINNQSLLGRGNINITGGVTKCRINVNTLVAEPTGNEPIIFKMPLSDVQKYKNYDVVEIYSSENGVETPMYTVYHGALNEFYATSNGTGWLTGMFIGDETTTDENKIGFELILSHTADTVDKDAKEPISSRAVYTALQGKQDNLSHVLKEIDLTGTDADRKAKLDQFAKDWKTLTNATDMTGARFACHMTTTTGEGYAILVYDSVDGAYIGVVTDDSYKSYIVHVLESDGSIFAETLGGNTEIDTSMSDTSTNPVQNKVIKAYIDGLVGNVAAQLAQI